MECLETPELKQHNALDDALQVLFLVRCWAANRLYWDRVLADLKGTIGERR